VIHNNKTILQQSKQLLVSFPNHSCCGKAVCVWAGVCVCVCVCVCEQALVIQHTTRMVHIVCGLSISNKHTIFRKMLLNKKCVLIFSTNVV
jgi:hypothetical protein